MFATTPKMTQTQYSNVNVIDTDDSYNSYNSADDCAFEELDSDDDASNIDESTSLSDESDASGGDESVASVV
ncbi:unnamed protein product [Phytophthora lilii]|uniref:Unnamed protein product n=1 Tax=Phytophthora lilii TaxID=2077276 RepID=A0A9W6WYG2_9STRA|nr:unnamed protein product [Phytophthora lilii]